MHIFIVLIAATVLLLSLSDSSNLNFAPCTCQPVRAPVCGTDDVTYSSACMLNCISRDNVHRGLPPISVARNGDCADSQCVCPKTENPVCGTDNNTYINKCLFSCMNSRRNNVGARPVRIAYIGPCSGAYTCENNIAPVCGTDSKTYRNICYLYQASQQMQRKNLPTIFLRSWGACNFEGCICPLTLEPVCANNGKEYSNKCTFQCERRRADQLGQSPLEIINNGPCKSDCMCSNGSDPVCASDHRTYGSSCLLGCENRLRHKKGLPQLKYISKGECGCFCPTTWKPVCASDGKTYTNPCHMNCENQRRERVSLPVIQQVNNGECLLSCNCGVHVDPVCGIDGRTYSNPCFIDCENRERMKQGLQIYMYTKGVCPCVCPYIYDPVCVSDGRTFSNPCLVECENKKGQQSRNMPSLRVVYKGHCGCDCSNTYDPVCGTDGNTYGNRCVLECENKRRIRQGLSSLGVMSKDVCPCLCSCPAQWQPVCGSDKKTYWNICYLTCNSNCYLQRNWPPVLVTKNGTCHI